MFIPNLRILYACFLIICAMILAIGIISDMFFCFQLSIKASMVKWGQAPLALVVLSLVSMLSITFLISTALRHIVAELPRPLGVRLTHQSLPMAQVKAHNVARSIGASRRRVCLNVPFRPVGMTGCLSKSSCPLRTRPESRSPNSAAVPDSRPSPCSATFRCSPRPWRPQVRRAVRQDSCPKQAPCVWRSAAPHSSSTVSLHDTLSLKRHYTITVSHRHPKLFLPFQRNKQLANLAIRHGV